MSESLGLARYDAMVTAIAAAYKVDEVKELRDQARALEVYAQQAMNLEAEQKAAEIRIRAERRAGELLAEMKERGERRRSGGRHPNENNQSRSVIMKPPSHQPPPPKLKDLGISLNQSSKWQQLAAIPKDEFEKAVSLPGTKPTTEGIINSHLLKTNPPPQVSNDALWVWGRLCDFEKARILQRNPEEVINSMTESMRDDVSRLVPQVIQWLERACCNTAVPK